MAPPISLKGRVPSETSKSHWKIHGTIGVWKKGQVVCHVFVFFVHVGSRCVELVAAWTKHHGSCPKTTHVKSLRSHKQQLHPATQCEFLCFWLPPSSMDPSVWIYGRDPYPDAPVVLLKDDKLPLASNASNLFMEFAQCRTDEMAESQPDEVQEVLDTQEALRDLQWTLVTVHGHHAIGLGSNRKKYERAARLGIVLSFLREGDMGYGYVRQSRPRLFSLFEKYQNGRSLGQAARPCNNSGSTVKRSPAQRQVCPEAKQAEAPPEAREVPDPWAVLPAWAASDSSEGTPWTMAKVESLRLRGERFPTEACHKVMEVFGRRFFDVLTVGGGPGNFMSRTSFLEFLVASHC